MDLVDPVASSEMALNVEKSLQKVREPMLLVCAMHSNDFHCLVEEH